MSDSMKEKIASDLQRAKDEGKLRSDRIREIVRSAIAQAIAELKEGSGEIRTLAKEAVTTVVENVQERGKEAQSEIAASIEGVIQGMSESKREAIAKTEAEVQQLQAQIDSEEQKLQTEIDQTLSEIEQTSQTAAPSLQSTIKTAVDALKDTGDATEMRKRYAQLQAQLAIVRANLAARYGDRFDQVNKKLDEAKVWYDQARPQAEVTAEQVKQKSADFESKLGEAGTALAKQEERARQLLKELWHSATELFQEKLQDRKK